MLPVVRSEHFCCWVSLSLSGLPLFLFLLFLSLLLAFSVLSFLFICCKGQSSAARLCCQKPLFTKGRNKWLTQTTFFISASPQAVFPSTARETPSPPTPHFCQSPTPHYTAPLHPSGSLHTSPLPWVETWLYHLHWVTHTKIHFTRKGIALVLSHRRSNEGVGQMVPNKD